MIDKSWLHKWQSILSNKTVLELGCGHGRDTGDLLTLVNSLVACDINVDDISMHFKQSAKLSIQQIDHSQPLPFDDQIFDVVVASLSLHYFDWQKTLAIVAEISRILTPNGCFICRLNSINDTEFGATGYQQLDTNYFHVKGINKRFFDQKMIEDLFSEQLSDSTESSKVQWTLNQLNEQQIDRYEKPKFVWEFIAQKSIITF
jgi:ubiquinone/menaquinone biosynthesis C-methylase UbiE